MNTKIPHSNKYINFLKTKQKLVLTILFLVFVFLPLPEAKRDQFSSLVDSSIARWLQAIIVFYGALKVDFTNMIEIGINQTTAFIDDLFSFFLKLISLDFTVFATTGYILSILYFIIPIGVLLIAISFIKRLIDTKDSEVNFVLDFKYLLTIKNLAITLLLIPFALTESWIIGLIAIILLLVHFVQLTRERLEIRKEKLSIYNFPWFRAYLYYILGVFLALPTMESIISQNNLSFVTLLNISSPEIMFLLVSVGFLVILSEWSLKTVHQAGKEDVRQFIQSQLLLTLKSKLSFSTFIYGVFILGIVFPAIDFFILNGIAYQVIFTIMNLPWSLSIAAFDPAMFVDLFLALIRVAFDTMTNVSRDIIIALIPVIPTDVSIVGSIQGSFFVTLILFFIFLVLYTIFLSWVTITENPDNNSSSTSLKRYLSPFKLKELRKYFILMIVSILGALVFYFANPEVFLESFGDQYTISTDAWEPILIIAFLATIFAIVSATCIWVVIQLRKGRSMRIVAGVITINSIAVITALIMIIPFIQMIKNSLQTNIQNTQDFYAQGLIPDPFNTGYYAQLFGLYPPAYATLEYRVITWLFNSIIVSVTVTAFLVLFSAMAGYCFAKREFIGRKPLFALTIAILMVPSYVQVIPLYIELNRLDLIGTLIAVILPFLIQPLGVFLTTEFMRGIPDDYLDAARIDGYSEIQIFLKIVLPLSIPVMSVLIIINFIGNWNAFIWPLLLIENSAQAVDLRLLPLGMYRINAELEEQIGLVLALATVIVIPIFVILFMAQDYIKKGVTVEGLKG
ncbi:MAG: carbohydrate ABC transporter permease [Candidatus Hodarchaeales archaeon]|jgi:multiple sugar transport system permease protein